MGCTEFAEVDREEFAVMELSQSQCSGQIWPNSTLIGSSGRVRDSCKASGVWKSVNYNTDNKYYKKLLSLLIEKGHRKVVKILREDDLVNPVTENTYCKVSLLVLGNGRTFKKPFL